MSETLTVIDHPLIQHKLTLLRAKATPTAQFRQILREISLLLAFDATKDLELTETDIETPLEAGRFPILEGKKLCFVSILRAGDGLLTGMLDLVPSARVGHIGLYRDPKTLEAVEYYFKVPEALEERLVVVVDPMLATGHSAIAAVSRLKRAGARRLKFICLVAAPEGARAGVGDAGDRLFGTA